MARKLTFEDLPAAVERMLEILESNTPAGASVAALQKRLTELERKIELLQAGSTPIRNATSTTPATPAKTTANVKSDAPARRVGRPRKVESASAESSSTPAETTTKTAPAAEKELIGAPYAAVMLGLKLGTIYQLTRTNKIPHIKEGAKILFDADVLKKWNRKRKSKRKPDKKRTPKPAADK